MIERDLDKIREQYRNPWQFKDLFWFGDSSSSKFLAPKQIMSPPKQDSCDIFEGIFDSDFFDKKPAPKVETKRAIKQELSHNNSLNYAFIKGSNQLTNFESNQLIISELEKLCAFSETEGDKNRHFAYRKAIASIRSFDKEIKNVEDVDHLPGIGEKIKDKINEIIRTGALRKTKIIGNDQRLRTIELLKGIWGVGQEMALRLYSLGCNSVEDVKLEYESLLNRQQKVGK